MSGLQGLGQAAAAFGGTSPTDLATSLVARASLSGSVDTAALNRDLAELARTDPALAAQTRAQAEAQLTPVERGTLAQPVTGTLPDGSPVAFSPDGMEQGRWIDTIRTSANPAERATYDNLVRTAGSPDPEAIKTVLADAYARGIAPDQVGVPAATPANDNPGILGRIANTADAINPLNRLSDLAQSGAAEIGRSAGLGQTEWGGRLQTLLDTPGTATAFRQGINEGILEGGKDMVVGVAGLAGRGVQYGMDRGLGGFAGDALRGVTGDLPSWADAIVPSANRADATQQSVSNSASAIGGYIASRANDRGLLAADAVKAFDGAWGSLKADHAAAAAHGPEAEARWFGQAMGRVTFEVGSTFIPVAGVAGKVDKGADALRAADGLADATRGADAAVDTARGADAAVDTGRAEAVDDAVPGSGARSLRDQYMGGTPDKYSRTGREVVERMKAEGDIIGDGQLVRGEQSDLRLKMPDGTLVQIDSKIDMAHRTDAVTWWNEVGKYFGPKSPEVREFMLDPDNYALQHRSINRSEGAKLDETYDTPVAPRFDTLKE